MAVQNQRRNKRKTEIGPQINNGEQQRSTTRTSSDQLISKQQSNNSTTTTSALRKIKQNNLHQQTPKEFSRSCHRLTRSNANTWQQQNVHIVDRDKAQVTNGSEKLELVKQTVKVENDHEIEVSHRKKVKVENDSNKINSPKKKVKVDSHRKTALDNQCERIDTLKKKNAAKETVELTAPVFHTVNFGNIRRHLRRSSRLEGCNDDGESVELTEPLSPVKREKTSVTTEVESNERVQTDSSPPKRHQIGRRHSKDNVVAVNRLNSSTSCQVNKSSNQSFCNNVIQEQEQLPDRGCMVPGCDSTGHLSGAFMHHSTMDSCPLFHNQTPDHCVQRYNDRVNRTAKLAKQVRSPNKLSKTPVEKMEQVWNERDNQLTEISRKLEKRTMPIFYSRQPDFTDFAPSIDLELFLEAKSRTAELMHNNLARDQTAKLINNTGGEVNDEDSQKQLTIEKIVLGGHMIDTLYVSAYPDEMQNCRTLFICEFCLKYTNSLFALERHSNRCTLKHPPGNEIYRKNELSFFEIDGNRQKEYCQNLCLLSKLFLDSKTLFFEVEPFLFYILTHIDERGAHIIGYFSKEKHSASGCNVSCILVLPQHQHKGYGRMLIDFSYLLTKIEGKVGSPEKPISDLGLISYRKYWKLAIKEYLSKMPVTRGGDIYLKDMSQKTGIHLTDITSTLQLMGIIKYWKGEHIIVMPLTLKKAYAKEVKSKKESFGNKVIDYACLHWQPTEWPLPNK